MGALEVIGLRTGLASGGTRGILYHAKCRAMPDEGGFHHELLYARAGSFSRLAGGDREPIDQGTRCAEQRVRASGAVMKRWARSVQAVKLQEAQAALADEVTSSQRQVAEQLEIPRSTLQHWQQRQARLEAEPAVVRFFESPEGVVFLHRLQLAAHVVIPLLGSGGIRKVRLLLELSGLDRFIATSYSAQQRVSTAVETETVDFGTPPTGALGRHDADTPDHRLPG